MRGRRGQLSDPALARHADRNAPRNASAHPRHIAGPAPPTPPAPLAPPTPHRGSRPERPGPRRLDSPVGTCAVVRDAPAWTMDSWVMSKCPDDVIQGGPRSSQNPRTFAAGPGRVPRSRSPAPIPGRSQLQLNAERPRPACSASRPPRTPHYSLPRPKWGAIDPKRTTGTELGCAVTPSGTPGIQSQSGIAGVTRPAPHPAPHPAPAPGPGTPSRCQDPSHAAPVSTRCQGPTRKASASRGTSRGVRIALVRMTDGPVSRPQAADRVGPWTASSS